MKRVFLILLFALFSCSSDEITEPQQNDCYTILSRGVDARGNFIIVKISQLQYINFIKYRSIITFHIHYISFCRYNPFRYILWLNVFGHFFTIQ